MEKDVIRNDEPVKRKKGRPRKEVPIVDEVKQEEKKKRGRKKKEVVVEEIKQKKKRGRKAAVKYFSSSIRKKIPLTTVLQDNNNFILHLNIKNDENDNDKIDDNLNIINDDNINFQDNIIDDVFEKLKNENYENISNLQKEYDELIEKEDSILSDIINNEEDLTELYEKRLANREYQDNVLFNKLETYHKDNNVIDKSFANEDNKNYNQEQNRKKGFFEILSNFIHNDNWLNNTNVCCWWCCHSFDTVPIGMPEKYDELKKKFLVKGVFCSFSCMIAYKKEIKHNCIKDYLIKFLYTRLTGTFLLDVHLEPAPARCCLKMFGGDLTIEEFRNSFKENKVYRMVEYPMYVCKDYIEEVDIQNVKKVNQNVFTEVQQKITNLDDKRIEDAKLRLSQIEKTTITLGNTIDKFIKFS